MTPAQLVKLAAFVAPLGFDTLAVAILLGLRRTPPLAPALTFAVFEAGMPLVGLLLGLFIGARFEAAAVIIGGLILIGVAVHVARETLEDEDEAAGFSFRSARLAAAAGLAVSMDELAVGFPMGASKLPIGATLLAIGVQAFAVTVIGILLGRRLGEAAGETTSRLAGLVAAAGFAMLGVYLIVQRLAPGLPL